MSGGDEEGIMTDQDPTQPYSAPPPVPAAAADAPAWSPVAPAAAAAAPDAPPPPAWAPAAPPVLDGSPLPPAAYAVGPEIPVVEPVQAPRRRRNPLRWVVALVIVALVVGTAAGATMLLTASSGNAAVLAYVPADTIVYGEMRLDLPGNQRAEVARTLSAFPGFADQAALGTKLGEVLDRLVKSATNGKHDYQTEIAPWFGGQIAIAEGPTPTLSVTSPDAAAKVRVLAVVNVTDTAKATAWINGVLAETNVKMATVAYNGTDIQQIQQASDSSMAQLQAGYAIIGKVAVFGDLTSIKAAIDTKGTTGLGSVPGFQKAVAALPGDHVGFAWEDLRAVFASSADSVKSLDKEGTATAALSVLEGLLPEWSASSIRAADGNLVMESAQPTGALGPTVNRTSDIAALAPPNTIALVDLHDVGKTLGTLRDKFAADPKLGQYVKQLDSFLGLAGGFQGTAGWIGDVGVAVTRNGDSVSGGILIRPDDPAAATRLLTQLRSLFEMSGGGSGISISDEQYNGATITTVDLSMLAPLLEQSMGSSGVTVPSSLKLVYAVTDKVVVMSLDPAFARAVVDAAAGGASLAKDPRFSALVAKAGAQSTGVSWLDITASRELVEGILPADARAKYDADIRPYLLPLDALISTGAIDGDLARGTMILSIKH